MPRQCGYTARIATMMAITALYVSPALALTPQKGPPQRSYNHHVCVWCNPNRVPYTTTPWLPSGHPAFGRR
jgi:hypothetical protein